MKIFYIVNQPLPALIIRKVYAKRRLVQRYDVHAIVELPRAIYVEPYDSVLKILGVTKSKLAFSSQYMRV